MVRHSCKFLKNSSSFCFAYHRLSLARGSWKHNKLFIQSGPPNLSATCLSLVKYQNYYIFCSLWKALRQINSNTQAIDLLCACVVYVCWCNPAFAERKVTRRKFIRLHLKQTNKKEKIWDYCLCEHLCCCRWTGKKLFQPHILQPGLHKDTTVLAYDGMMVSYKNVNPFVQKQF